MSSFLFRILGVDKLVGDLSKDLDESIKELISPIYFDKEDSVSILKDLLTRYGVNLEIKESKEIIDETRRLTSLASNVTPLSIERPEEALWNLAQAIKPKGVKKCQKSQQ